MRCNKVERMKAMVILTLSLSLFWGGVLYVEAAPADPAGTHPNVLIWLMDDVGFGQPGAFGGPVETPTLDTLAQGGLRFNNFHSTAICSSSRASLLTGRNHHAVGFGNHAGFRSDDPGYQAQIPASAGSLAKVLKMNGYSTWVVGKWDQLPLPHINEKGPFRNWPSGQGFDHFYGFLYADMDHFHPILWRDHMPIEPARGRDDYHLTTDMADQAIAYLRERQKQNSDKPFLLYWASGAGHAPHHAPQEYLDHYRGRFDAGWQHEREQTLARQKKQGLVPEDVELPEWPANIPSWDSLNKNERLVATRSMEAFAAQLTHADHEFGRIIAELKKNGELENTIVIVTSDNGASSAGGMHGAFNEWRFSNGLQTSTEENLKHIDNWGGPSTYPEYPAGWAVAGNTPFRYYKTQVHYGGVREPMLVYWPAGIKAHGGVRNQFHHLNDVMPTVLDVAGIEPPAEIDGVKQQRFDGVSMRYAFAKPQAPTRHPVQYFELFGNRAIVADNWKAVVVHRKEPWKFTENLLPYENDEWELYNLKKDFNETHNLADQNPQKLAELQKLFDREAKRNNVYPLTPDFAAFQQKETEKLLAANGGRFVYRAGEFRRHIQGGGAPPVGALGSFDLTADLTVPESDANGVIVAEGGSMGGYALYLQQGRLVFSYNYVGTEISMIKADQPLSSGQQQLKVVFRKTTDGGAKVTLFAREKRIGAGTVNRLVPRLFEGSDAFNLGFDEGSHVSPEYDEKDVYTGKIDQVVFDFSVR